MLKEAKLEDEIPTNLISKDKKTKQLVERQHFKTKITQ